MFKVETTRLDGLSLIKPFYSEDIRGYFMKTYEQSIFSEHGISIKPYECFYTTSKQGTVRGLHFQTYCCQDKLVYVLNGAVFDVAVDLREGSPTFGQWEGFYLSEENRQMLYIPKGFAHGFLALEEGTLFSYLCGDRYDPNSDGGILWNDPELNVQWPLDKVERVIVSEKDQGLPTFSQFCMEHGALMKQG